MDKQAPSAEAVELSRKISVVDNIVFIGVDEEGDIDSTILEVALIIDTALRAAEIRGIKAGLEEAAVLFDGDAHDYAMDGLQRENYMEITMSMENAKRIRAISSDTVICKGE